MYDSWEIEDGRVKGSPEPVVMTASLGDATGAYGKKQIKAVKRLFQQKITRHHVVNIQVLQNTWKQAVKRRDEEMVRALARGED